eukprot:jgi/Psemu1/323727/estExt_fgenesh1_pg.C_910030
MEQHDYLRNLTEDNCVNLNLSMTFPPVVPLKPVLYRGRDYLRFVQKSLLAKPPADEEERQYLHGRILQERRLVDYQISQLRSSQKADVGFTLSSVVPPPSRNGSRDQGKNPRRYQPGKWSMAAGCSTDVVYPGVAELARMAAAAKDPKNKEYQAVAEKHPVTMFVNTSYHAAPTTQIFGTANLNNDNETHQYSLGSTHTFSNQTACRYGMTILNRSPLPDSDPVIFNLKTYRHLQGIGTTAAEVTTVWGHFSKLTAMVTHEVTSLATHPTLGFGLEHDISLGRWAWIWELHYNQSTFRIPISVVQLGSLTNHRAFYTQKFYYGIYCLLLQSIVADLLEELGGSDRKTSGPTSNAGHNSNEAEPGSKKRQGFPLCKTKLEAERQLALMQTVAEAKRYRESQRQNSNGNGLIILTATYWHRLRHNHPATEDRDEEEEEEDQDPCSWVYEVVSMDATAQLQFWVKNGKLLAPSGIPKSSWMGFYTLATESKFRKGRRRHRNRMTGPKLWLVSGKRHIQRLWNELWRTRTGQAPTNSDPLDDNLTRSNDPGQQEGPQLTVRYCYNGNVYEVTVGETEALCLPFQNDSNGDRVELLGHAEFVQ